MTKAAPPNFAIVDEKFESHRSGPRLDAFDTVLSTVEVNKAFDIQTTKNAKGKTVPSIGFNLKAANLLYAPKVFKKRRVRDTAGNDVLRIYRIK